jgi:hypothetical protein
LAHTSVGLISGVCIVLPNGAIIQPLAEENLGALEPHILQKALPKVLGASITYSPTSLFPVSHLN